MNCAIGYLEENNVQVLKKDIARVDHIAIVVSVILIASGIIFWYLKKVKKFNKNMKVGRPSFSTLEI